MSCSGKVSDAQREIASEICFHGLRLEMWLAGSQIPGRKLLGVTPPEDPLLCSSQPLTPDGGCSRAGKLLFHEALLAMPQTPGYKVGLLS